MRGQVVSLEEKRHRKAAHFQVGQRQPLNSAKKHLIFAQEDISIPLKLEVPFHTPGARLPAVDLHFLPCGIVGFWVG